MIQFRDFDADQLGRFRLLQRSAYATLEEVAATLRDGDTEIDAARRLRRAFAGQGVRSYFHVPVALFGDRTAYPGQFGQFEALPTARRLQDGDAVILDAAPVFEGTMIDVSLAVPRAGALQAAFAQADALLRELRALVLARAKEQRLTMREIAREVDSLIVGRGFENCHRKHIGMVLAHRMAQVQPAWLARRRLWGLSPLPVGWFFWRSWRSSRGNPELTPNWNHTRQSDCPPQPGLWAMEPHVGLGPLGSKFEEILVVTERDAWYLDDDLPHHRRWAANLEACGD
ncbi:MAG: M24 family metallopeptidase [Ramlibacter sp.]